MQSQSKLRSVFRDRTAVQNGVLVAGGFFLFTGVVTGLLPTPVFDRMVPRTALEYGLLATTSLLLGVYVVQRSTLKECSGDACAYGGAAGGFVAVACPHCNAILVAAVGTSWLATYVDPLRPLLGGAAIALISGVLYRRWQREVSQ
ncbi:hypothetical protein B2G88_07245 [Natronolimnobius baerhuensis]|uniref:Uncharacterized protein n=1 Tax=Natronolimnobius baerhuensis TaxID=253108 RepID=A0A202E7J2_9EURY|nr:hypothetical protein B2G88_07245 [Natronolimnobius baerhuensis]